MSPLQWLYCINQHNTLYQDSGKLMKVWKKGAAEMCYGLIYAHPQHMKVVKQLVKLDIAV